MTSPIHTQAESSQSFAFLNLPLDYIAKISSYLTPHDFGSLSQTCKKVHVACQLPQAVSINTAPKFLLQARQKDLNERTPTQQAKIACAIQERLISTDSLPAPSSTISFIGYTTGAKPTLQEIVGDLWIVIPNRGPSHADRGCVHIRGIKTTFEKTFRAHNNPICSYTILHLDRPLLVTASFGEPFKFWDLKDIETLSEDKAPTPLKEIPIYIGENDRFDSSSDGMAMDVLDAGALITAFQENPEALEGKPEYTVLASFESLLLLNYRQHVVALDCTNLINPKTVTLSIPGVTKMEFSESTLILIAGSTLSLWDIDTIKGRLSSEISLLDYSHALYSYTVQKIIENDAFPDPQIQSVQLLGKNLLHISYAKPIQDIDDPEDLDPREPSEVNGEFRDWKTNTLLQKINCYSLRNRFPLLHAEYAHGALYTITQNDLYAWAVDTGENKVRLIATLFFPNTPALKKIYSFVNSILVFGKNKLIQSILNPGPTPLTPKPVIKESDAHFVHPGERLTLPGIPYLSGTRLVTEARISGPDRNIETATLYLYDLMPESF